MRALATLLAAYALLPLLVGTDAAVATLEPLAPEYMREQVPTLAAHEVWDWTHRVGGAALLVAGLLQMRGFSRWHRVLGRAYVVLALVVAVGGGWMALTAPFSPAETLPALVFAALLLSFVALGIATIITGRVADHQRWMARSYAVVLGPIVVRGAHMLLTIGLPEREAMAPAFWIGWSIPLIALEARRGRPLAVCMPEDEPRLTVNGVAIDPPAGPERRATQGAKRRRRW